MKRPIFRDGFSWRRLAIGLLIGAIGAAAGAGLVFLNAALGAPFSDGRGLILLIVLVLLVLVPLNGLQVKKALRGDFAGRLPSRISMYATTAGLWALIAAGGLAAAAEPNGWIDWSPLTKPLDWKAFAALSVSLGLAGGMAIWARDVQRNRRKRAWLRAHYKGGVRLIAPKTRTELAVFRAATVVSSAGEEVAYRLVLLGVLAAWLEPISALILSSIGFALGHTYQGVRAAAITGGFGLLAGGMTWWTGSLWPAILFHIVWNQAAASMLWDAFQAGRQPPREAPPPRP